MKIQTDLKGKLCTDKYLLIVVVVVAVVVVIVVVVAVVAVVAGVMVVAPRIAGVISCVCSFSGTGDHFDVTHVPSC